jgi:hypothetical protein
MTRSIPRLDRLTETTIPKRKIAIGTKSSIGIAHPSVWLRKIVINIEKARGIQKTSRPLHASLA